MKVLIAPDSFKESLSAVAVAEAIALGWRKHFPQAQIVLLPVADGGEGTTQTLVNASGGKLYNQKVTGPMGAKITAQWGVLADGKTAVIETAAASGLHLVAANQRNPLLASSRGVGELILAALDKGMRKIVIGLGGSACNDAGAGMLQALGVQLLDERGEEISRGGGALGSLRKIELAGVDPRLAQVQLQIACDVDNPLIGAEGASAVFGPQKGADLQMVAQLDNNLKHFAEMILQTTAVDICAVPGAGAAGGLGGAFLAFTNATLSSGIDLVLDALNIDQHLIGAELVITGEGQIDNQSVRGKVPIGVARRAKAQQCPVIALAGSVRAEREFLSNHGIDAAFSILPGVLSLEQALAQAAENLTQCAANLAAIWAMKKGGTKVESKVENKLLQCKGF